MNSRFLEASPNASAGGIVVLMMALVFVPIIAAHAAMAWWHEIAEIAPRQLAAVVNLALSAF